MTPKWPRAIREVRSGLPQSEADPQEREPDPQAEAEPALEPEPATGAAAPAESPGDEIQELAAMAEGLLAQAAELRRQTQQLAAELAAADEPAAPGDPDAHVEPDRQPVSGMRIVAVNMAAAGRSREEAERYLREQFGESPDPALLDEVFGGPSD